MSPYAPVDLNLEPIQARCSGQPAYLHTSPEYAMKQLLSAGSGDIYQLSHVFRDGEIGRLHRPEFTMVEWYRVGFTLDQMIQETCAFACLFLGSQPIHQLSYRQAFITHCQLDPFTTSDAELAERCRIDGALVEETSSRDDLLDQLLTLHIEPRLGREALTVLMHYPASQAALAQTTHIDGHPVAERFELYYRGIELANGYHELADSQEQQRRLEQATCEREAAGKATLPIDREFVKSLENLPDCCGVAAGFDRLLMLQENRAQLADLLPFDPYF